MIFRNCLVLYLASSVSSFFVTSPLAGGRFGTRNAPHGLQVSLSESSSELENSAVDDLAEAVEGIDHSSSGVLENDAGPASKSERHTVYVGNLPYSVEVKEIRDMFSEHVDVRYVNLPRHRESGQVKGFAFVDVGTADDIPKAIEALNGIKVEERSLRVARYLAKDQIRSTKPADGSKKLYVGNIPYGATKEDVNEFFSAFGEILDVFIPVNNYGDSRGFAFISVKEEDADTMIEEANGAEFLGRSLVVNVPLPPGEKPQRRARQQNTKLFVGNLSFYTSSETLVEVFEEFGDVIDCYIPRDVNNGNSRGFGFVTMEKEAADEAIAALDGCELDGRSISVNEARPRPKGDFDGSSDEIEPVE